jgi:hypothetical protein
VLAHSLRPRAHCKLAAETGKDVLAYAKGKHGELEFNDWLAAVCFSEPAESLLSKRAVK